MTKPSNFFSREQQDSLRANVYTRKVTEDKISFTLAFKQLVITEIDKPGMTFPKILQNAGYDPKVLGRVRMDNILRSIRHEAASEQGLHESGRSVKPIAARDLEKQKMKTAIRDLQEHVDYLEQEITFLKKISLLRNKP